MLILDRARTALHGRHPSKQDPLVLTDHNGNTVGSAYFVGR
jgi:hypothetical protein